MFMETSMSAASTVDVIIVGGGLAGTLAALLLDRTGCKVALIDRHQIYPTDFRAEQLVGYQVDILKWLGLLEIVVGDLVPAKRAVAMRAGKVLGVVDAPHYGIRYQDMVNQARRHLPPSVRLICSKVSGIDLTADRQRVRLATGDVVEGRLVILATGLGQQLLRPAGIDRTMIRKRQSFAFGFDVEAASPAMFSSSVLVAYGEAPADRIDYLTLFSVGNKLRGNLFTFHDRDDPWVGRFMQRPCETLKVAMPHLEQTIGRIQAIGPVQRHVTDLAVATGCRRDGVVIVGDGFQTSCPAAGTGISRLLNDVEILCTSCIPVWLATAGMGTDKIGAYYANPVKVSADAEALRVAEYRRFVTVETGLFWRLHRQRVKIQNALRAMLASWPWQGGRWRSRNLWTQSGMAPTPLHR